MTRSHDNDQYYRDHTTRRREPEPRGGLKYVCLYCGQGCSSTDILVSHERTCPRRASREAEWRQERKRHNSHLGGKSGSEYEDK